MLLLLLACADRPDALIAEDRSGHWLDRPWPSDEVLTPEGTVDWGVLPEAPTDLGTTLVGGWAAQASGAVTGASHQPAIYLRFEETFEITAEDVGLIDGNGAAVPIEWHWVEETHDDPWLTENLLVMIPEHTAPLRSGERYVAWVSDGVADAPEGWEPPEGAPEDVAIATAFTVQDSVGQLESLLTAVDDAVDAHPEYLTSENWKEVTRLVYAQGESPSGNAATVATVTYSDGSTDETFLGPNEGEQEIVVELGESWPFRVYEGRLTTVAFQGLEDQPWASSGLGLLNDFERYDEGWIHFDGATLTSDWEAESMRVVVQVPRSGAGPFPVVTWDHGTGGHAYNAISRVLADDDPSSVAEALSGAVVVSRDQPLYGQRYPLIDEGFGSSLGFYNIGNLPCFRDNQRQAAADHRVLFRFVRDGLDGLAEVDVERIGAFGHSLGSVTAHGALVAQGTDGPRAGLMSGTGGYFTYYVLETGLLGQGNDVVDVIAPLLGIDEDDLADATPGDLVAALIGLPEEAWDNLDRTHPVLQLFQAIMDPSDPLMLVAEQAVPDHIILGIDDYQVPNVTTDWLSDVLPDATVTECQRSYEYDGHYCAFREVAGFEAMTAFVEGL